jgi:hypothetical protein
MIISSDCDGQPQRCAERYPALPAHWHDSLQRGHRSQWDGGWRMDDAVRLHLLLSRLYMYPKSSNISLFESGPFTYLYIASPTFTGSTQIAGSGNNGYNSEGSQLSPCETKIPRSW